MNLFVLDTDPGAAARAHYDRHVGKMLLEACQILSTAHWLHDNGSFHNFNDVYLPTHERHPCVRWVCRSIGNYVWAYQLAMELADEYHHRFGRNHGSAETLMYLCQMPALPACEREGFAVAVTGAEIEDGPAGPSIVYDFNCWPLDDAGIVAAYREYYRTRKAHLRGYTNRRWPEWM